jgi:hypothetical protein
LCDEHGARLQGLDCPCGHAAEKWRVFDEERKVVIAFGTLERITIIEGQLGIAVDLFEQAGKLHPINRRKGVIPRGVYLKRKQNTAKEQGAIKVHSVSLPRLAGL